VSATVSLTKQNHKCFASAFWRHTKARRFSASSTLDGRLEADVEQMVRRIFALTPPDGTGSESTSAS
jgi:hypothetical protein